MPDRDLFLLNFNSSSATCFLLFKRAILYEESKMFTIMLDNIIPSPNPPELKEIEFPILNMNIPHNIKTTAVFKYVLITFFLKNTLDCLFHRNLRFRTETGFKVIVNGLYFNSLE